jgi:hypothetical protein
MSGDFVKPYYDPVVRPYSASKISKVIKADFAKKLKSFPGTSKPCDPNAKPVADIPFAAPKFSIAPGFPGTVTMTAPVPLPFCTHPEGIVVQFQHFKNNSWGLVSYKGSLTGTLSPDGKGTVTLADLAGNEKGKYRVRAWVGGKFFLKNGKTAWIPFELQ